MSATGTRPLHVTSAQALALSLLLLAVAAPSANAQPAPPATDAQPAPAGLNAGFAQLASDFDARAKAGFGDEAVTDRGTLSVFLTRRHLGQVLADTFNRAGIAVRLTYPQTPIDVPETEVRIGHQDLPDCSPGGCEDCGQWDVLCGIRHGACEAKNAVDKGICELKKAAIQAVSDKKLFTITYHAVVVEGRAAAGFHLAADDSLNHVTVTALNPEGSLTVDGGSATFHPEVLVGVAFACAPFTVTVPGETANVSESRISTTATLKPQPTPNGMKLGVELSPVTASLHFGNHPILDIVGHNLHALVLCPVAWSIAVTGGAVFDLLWDHAIPVEGRPGPVELTVGEFKLSALGQQLAVQTRLNPLSLELTGSLTPLPRVPQVAPAVSGGSTP